MQIVAASDRSLLISFGDRIDAELHAQVLRMFRALRGSADVVNLNPGYASILVTFDPLRVAHGEMEARIRERWAAAEQAPVGEPRRVEIPVVYGGESGPDLEFVADANGLSVEQVIALHSGAEYLVYFLGFSPGFPYLGGMPERIAAPRLEQPRTRVPAGSVAIGGSQTGVYPVESPGGWRLIGRTSLRLFRPEEEPPTLLGMGDRVRFVPIPKERF